MSDPSATPIFTPVATGTRRDGWTPERQTDFIAALSTLGIVSAAARSVGMSPKSAYALRQRPGAESFAAAWDRAVVEGGQRAYDTALGRALNGTSQPVFYRGRQIGERRVYNDRLVIAALNVHYARARKPA